MSLLNNSITDGVIVVTPEATHFSTNAPLVAVDPHYEINEYPSVISTNWEGAMEAMNYLLKLGHRRIGFISGRFDLQSANSRLRGYKDSLTQAGIPIDLNLITQGDFTADTNIGRITGDEVVQLYIRDEFACIPRPAKELKGFTRVRLLPGEKKIITFHLPVNQLAFYDHSLNMVLEAGKVIVMLGSSSEDIRLTGEFSISGSRKMSIKERVFFCPVDIQ